MTRILKKTLPWTAAALTVTVAGLALFITVRGNRRFEAPYPAVAASANPSVIARGRYLAFGPAHCADCHGEDARRAELVDGAEIPLSGGKEFHLPLGTVRVPNITPDEETGIGRLSDGQLARVLRHGVMPDGRAALPFMPFANLSDEDLTALVSFLRSQPPVRRPVAGHQVNVLGRAVIALMIEPRGPSEPIAARAPQGPTVENGRYLVHSVGNCVACHTRVDMRTGKLVGPVLGGGAEHPSTVDQRRTFVTPNLTPHPRWGWVATWPEEIFVARMHRGAVHDGSPMPWHAVRRMTDDDLRAIFRYLQTVPPVEGGPNPSSKEAVILHARL